MSAKKGDKCPNDCGGRLRIRTSRRAGNTYEQRLTCNLCNAPGGIVHASADDVWKRKRD